MRGGEGAAGERPAFGSWWVPVTCGGCGRMGRICVPCETCRAEMSPASPGSAAVFAYDGPMIGVMRALKSEGNRAAVGWLADLLATRVGAADVVTWVPTSPRRERERGYDQAALLAKAVGRRLDVPVRRTLRRATASHQTGRTRVERLADPPSFVATRPLFGSILLVDDVVTTGATLRSATAALVVAGAAEVCALAVAATPAGGAKRPGR
jgi:predicted amidophosphoribosyltransferase